MAQLIASGELDPLFVMESFIERAERANQLTSAVVDWRVDEARRAAKKVRTNVRRRDQLPPLAGVPFSVKEAIAVSGAPHTSGSVYRRGKVAAKDATAVQRLRMAGAIPFALTNMSEMSAQWECDNPVYGLTVNPHDPRRSPGGSSGGEGALVAAGGSAFGVGADTGGSIRIPAAMCGVFGHKPSRGTVPIDGHMPELTGNLAGYCGVGPMARHADDLYPLYALMSGRPATVGSQQGIVDGVASGLRVLLCTSLPGLGRPDPQVAAAVDRAGRALAGLGADVTELDTSSFVHPFLLWTANAKDDHPDPILASEVTDRAAWKLDLPAQLFKLAAGEPDHTAWMLSSLAAERIAGPLVNLIAPVYRAHAQRLRAALEHQLAGRSVIVMPAYPTAAFHPGRSLRFPMEFAWSGWVNVMGFPATTAPVGQARDGLPLAVQIIGAPGADRLTCEVARILDHELGGWICPGPILGER